MRVATLFLAVVSILFCTGTDAQTSGEARLSGLVTDTTGAAIASAKVVLSGGRFRATQLTDAKGEFVFEHVPAANGQLEVSVAGFESRRVEWSSAKDRSEIVLTPAGVAEQITVTANRTSTRLIETPTSVVVLSPQDLAATAALTTDDILRQVAGFSLFRRTDSRTANPTAQGVSLRGLGASGASRALVLADGFPLNDPFGGWVYWSRVPRAEIGRLEVASGGASHLYGSDAMGGVVEVLRKPADRSAFALDTSYGNEDTPDVSFTGSKQLGNWAGALSGELFRTDGYIPVSQDLRGSVDTPADSEHGVGEVTVRRNFGDRGSAFARGSLFGEDRDNGTRLQTNSTTVRELDFGTNWLNQDLGSLTLRAYLSRQVLNQTFSAVTVDRDSEALTRVQRVPAQQVGFSGQWSRPLGTRQNLVAGIEQWTVHGEDDETVFSSGTATSLANAGGREANWGGYLEDIVRVTDRWLLTLSGRVDRWQNYDAFSARIPLSALTTATVTPFDDRSETFFSPRLALLHRLTRNLALTASGYRSFRAPTLNELYRSFRVGNVFTQANDQLRAERLTGGEVGAIVSGWDQRFMLRGNFFWSEITRPIGNVTQSVTPTLITRRRQNLGRTRSRGVELELSGRVTNSFTLSGAYELTDATVARFPADSTLEGLEIPQVPRNQFTFQARYSKPFLLLGLQGRFVGDQFDDDRNTLLLERYFTMDLMASHPLRPGVELFVAAENLLNQRYDIGRTPVLTVGPPILARIGLRLQFGER
jgi:outer membrane receptor protein involved in Fe transport